MNWRKMKINVPEELLEVIAERVSSGKFASASEYLAALVKEDAAREAAEREAAAKAKGEAVPDWKDVRKEALARLEEKLLGGE